MTTASTEPRDGLSHRALAILRAIAAGRGQVSWSREPDLFIDGMPCCDQFTAHDLAHRDLLRPRFLAVVGEHVPAMLTLAGCAMVAETPAAA